MAVPRLGQYIEQLIKRAGTYTGGTVPSVAVHLAQFYAKPAMPELAPKVLRLNVDLMKEVEGFLREAGVPLNNLELLKAGTASDAIVLHAQKDGRSVVVKLTEKKGPFEKYPDLKENLFPSAIQKTVTSALYPKRKILVRIEPMMLPLDKAMSHLPESERVAVISGLRTRIRGKGLTDIDVKPDSFAVPIGLPAIESAHDVLSQQDTKAIDIGAVGIGEQYQPSFYQSGEAPTHIDQLFSGERPAVTDGTKRPTVRHSPQGHRGR